MTVMLTRRRVLTLVASAVALPTALAMRGAQARMAKWEGTALGASASIQLYHTDEAQAQSAIAAATAELERLEAMFSLYRADSVLSQLNREGKVDNAPAEFVELATQARSYAELTGGIFEPTIQPVWQVYFRHFTGHVANAEGPASEQIKDALALVDWRGLEISGDRVALAKPGMGLTLNGIAQGYITDKVTAVLRDHGFASMLVDMGEPRALAAKPDGSSWRIGVADPSEPSRAITQVDVVDKAVATSGGYGTTFDPKGRFTHLIEPSSGRTAPALAGVTVIADSAAKADALSTALSVAPEERRQAIISAAGGVTAIFVTPAGVTATLVG